MEKGDVISLFQQSLKENPKAKANQYWETYEKVESIKLPTLVPLESDSVKFNKLISPYKKNANEDILPGQGKPDTLSLPGMAIQEIMTTERDYNNDLLRIGETEKQAFLGQYNNLPPKSKNFYLGGILKEC